MWLTMVRSRLPWSSRKLRAGKSCRNKYRVSLLLEGLGGGACGQRGLVDSGEGDKSHLWKRWEEYAI
jgi:hypothetical protein